jgi:hypothetical protein
MSWHAREIGGKRTVDLFSKITVDYCTMHSGPPFNERVPQKRTKKKKLGSVIVILLHPYFLVNMGRNFLVWAGLHCHGFIHGPMLMNEIRQRS